MKSFKSKGKSEVKTEKTIELPVINEEFKRDESFNKIELESMQSLDFIEGYRSQINASLKSIKQASSYIGTDS